jgi:hypothetical protein
MIRLFYDCALHISTAWHINASTYDYGTLQFSNNANSMDKRTPLCNECQQCRLHAQKDSANQYWLLQQNYFKTAGLGRDTTSLTTVLLQSIPYDSRQCVAPK